MRSKTRSIRNIESSILGYMYVDFFDTIPIVRYEMHRFFRYEISTEFDTKDTYDTREDFSGPFMDRITYREPGWVMVSRHDPCGLKAS